MSLNFINPFDKSRQVPTSPTVSCSLLVHTHLYCLGLVILSQLTLDLLVFEEFRHFWHGLLQNQFRIDGWKLLKFLPGLELSPTLACRKEGIFEHAD